MKLQHLIISMTLPCQKNSRNWYRYWVMLEKLQLDTLKFQYANHGIQQKYGLESFMLSVYGGGITTKIIVLGTRGI